MALVNQGSAGSATSPGGYDFGVQGWQYNEARPYAITFFLDGSVMVTDQYGRPIKGIATESGKLVFFAMTPPKEDRENTLPYERRWHEEVENGKRVKKCLLATHEEVIDALAAERIDWLKLNRAGTPQLPYARLKDVPDLYPSDASQLARIPDPKIRKEVMRAAREVAEARARVSEGTEDEA